MGVVSTVSVLEKSVFQDESGFNGALGKGRRVFLALCGSGGKRDKQGSLLAPATRRCVSELHSQIRRPSFCCQQTLATARI